MQTQPFERNPCLVELVVFECFGDENCIFRCHGKNNTECVNQFETAAIFDGQTIYEVEREIEVLYG